MTFGEFVEVSTVTTISFFCQFLFVTLSPRYYLVTCRFRPLLPYLNRLNYFGSSSSFWTLIKLASLKR
jgi:hypothetical protein